MNSVAGSYFLQKHVYPCHTAGFVVLLDLRQDKYFAFDKEQGRLFESLFPGLNPNGAVGQSIPEFKAIVQFAETLVERGVLTKDQTVGKRYVTPAADPPVRSLSDEYLRSEVPVTPWHIVCFARSYSAAAISRRRKKIEDIVLNVAQQKQLFGASTDADSTSIHQLYTVFERLRPWFYTARDECLFDAITLLRFLAHFHLTATWVFGVRAAPFGAHCWLQVGDLALNDNPEHTGQFTPIMAV